MELGYHINLYIYELVLLSIGIKFGVSAGIRTLRTDSDLGRENRRDPTLFLEMIFLESSL
jgi:hypothetical protein